MYKIDLRHKTCRETEGKVRKLAAARANFPATIHTLLSTGTAKSRGVMIHRCIYASIYISDTTTSIDKQQIVPLV